MAQSTFCHSLLRFQAGMKSKTNSRAKSNSGENPISVLEKEILGLKIKCEALSKENLQLKVEKRTSQEEMRRVMEDLKKQLETSKVDQEKDCDECGNKAEKMKKVEKENHDLKQHNWHLKMVKLPHYVNLLHQKDEEIAELELRNRKECDENLLQEKAKDTPEEITLDEDDDICEIDIVPVPKVPNVVNVDFEDDPDDKSEILLISQKESSEKDRKQSEKTQFNEIIDSMMQTPPASDNGAVKEEKIDQKGNNPENLINNLMLNMRQKAKANEEAKKRNAQNSNREREIDGNQSGNVESESEGRNSGNAESEGRKSGNAESESEGRKSGNVESESEGRKSGNAESESEGRKSGKRKRKLFNSFCDDLMDENGEVHPQVRETISGHSIP